MLINFSPKSGIDLTSIKVPLNSKYAGYKCVLLSKSIHKSKYNEDENFAYIDSKREYIISKESKNGDAWKKKELKLSAVELKNEMDLFNKQKDNHSLNIIERLSEIRNEIVKQTSTIDLKDGYTELNENLVSIQKNQALTALKYGIPIVICATGEEGFGDAAGLYKFNVISEKEQLDSYLDKRNIHWFNHININCNFSYEMQNKLGKFIDEIMYLESKQSEKIKESEIAKNQFEETQNKFEIEIDSDGYPQFKSCTESNFDYEPNGLEEVNEDYLDNDMCL